MAIQVLRILKVDGDSEAPCSILGATSLVGKIKKLDSISMQQRCKEESAGAVVNTEKMFAFKQW